MAAWLLLTSFRPRYILASLVKEYGCLKNVNHQIGSKNEWLLLSASFPERFGLVFVVTLENAFLRGFILKPTGRA